MPEPTADRRPHLVLKATSQAQPFKAHAAQGGGMDVPSQDRARHGARLRAQLEAIKPLAQTAATEQRKLELRAGLGLQLEFVGQPQVAMAFGSLGNERGKNQLNHIEVLSVQTDGSGVTRANVFVPDGKLAHFERYVDAYLVESHGNKGHRQLIDTIADIRMANLRALWTDMPDLFPTDPAETFWWEVWLPTRGHRDDVLADFRKLATLCGCEVGEKEAPLSGAHGSPDAWLHAAAEPVNHDFELRG